MESLTFVSRGLFFGILLRRLYKFFALTNLSVSLKLDLVSYYVILILIYASSLLQSICSNIFSSLLSLLFFFACMFYQYIQN